jgi:hypothetical protein
MPARPPKVPLFGQERYVLCFYVKKMCLWTPPNAWCASTPSLSNRITTPDTRHTQASVQFTMLRHPSQLLMSHATFCTDTTIQQYSLQKNFNTCICHQRLQLPCHYNTLDSCSYLPLVSSMSLSCVPVDRSVHI